MAFRHKFIALTRIKSRSMSAHGQYKRKKKKKEQMNFIVPNKSSNRLLLPFEEFL